MRVRILILASSESGGRGGREIGSEFDQLDGI